MSDSNNSVPRKLTDEKPLQTGHSTSTSKAQTLNLTPQASNITGPAVLQPLSTTVIEFRGKWYDQESFIKKLKSDIAGYDLQNTGAIPKKRASSNKSSQYPYLAEDFEIVCSRCKNLKDKKNKCSCNCKEANFSSCDSESSEVKSVDNYNRSDASLADKKNVPMEGIQTLIAKYNKFLISETKLTDNYPCPSSSENEDLKKQEMKSVNDYTREKDIENKSIIRIDLPGLEYHLADKFSDPAGRIKVAQIIANLKAKIEEAARDIEVAPGVDLQIRECMKCENIKNEKNKDAEERRNPPENIQYLLDDFSDSDSEKKDRNLEIVPGVVDLEAALAEASRDIEVSSDVDLQIKESMKCENIKNEKNKNKTEERTDHPENIHYLLDFSDSDSENKDCNLEIAPDVDLKAAITEAASDIEKIEIKEAVECVNATDDKDRDETGIYKKNISGSEFNYRSSSAKSRRTSGTSDDECNQM